METTLRSKGIGRKWLRRSPVLLLAAFLAIAPLRPARADTPVFDAANLASQAKGWIDQGINWAENFGLLQNVIDLASKLNELTSTFMENSASQLEGLFASNMVLGKLQVDTAQAQIDAQHDTAMAQSAAEFTQNHVAPPPANKQLCQNVIARQGPEALVYFSKVVAAAASDGLNSLYRGPNEDGSGPLYAADTHAMRCPQKGTNPKTGSPLDGDPKCVDADPDFVDADINYSKIMSGLVKLELPKMVKSTVSVGGQNVNVQVPTPSGSGEKLKAQKMWMAAFHYCIQAAGPMDSPSFGEEAKGPEGRSGMAQFYHCAANRSAFSNPCTERLGYLTRPDCSNPDNAELCQQTKASCTQAVNSGVQLPPDIKSCDDGLSQRDAEYLANLTCKSNQHFQDGANSGANHAALAGQAIDCEAAMNQWRAKEALMQANILNGMIGSLRLSETCYAGTGAKQGRSTDRINAPRAVRPRDGDRAEAAAPVEASSMKKASARAPSVRKDGAMPRGVPIDADQISLPATLEQ